MTKDIPLCNFCEHLRYSKKGYYCRAFGGGGRKIPAEIISNQFFHNKPFPGDAEMYTLYVSGKQDTIPAKVRTVMDGMGLMK